MEGRKCGSAFQKNFIIDWNRTLLIDYFGFQEKNRLWEERVGAE